MGCDIHCWVEKRVGEAPRGPLPGFRRELHLDQEVAEAAPRRWVPVEVRRGDAGWSWDEPQKVDSGTYTKTSEWDIGRWYRLFTALAGVQDDGMTAHVLGLQRDALGDFPDSRLRGWPEDGGADVVEEGRSIAHSPSWLTLAELNAYDWAGNDLADFRDGHLASLNAVAAREGVGPEDLRIVFHFDN